MIKTATRLAVFAFALIQAGNASAIYTYVNGRWIVGSVVCDALLKAVPNPDSNPAQMECIVSTAQIEVLCQNPADNGVAPGQPAVQQILVGQAPITQGDITDKVKGKAEVSVEVSTDALLKPEYCVNPNWTPIKALVRVFTGTMNAYKCDTVDCAQKTLANSLKMTCALPSQYGFDNATGAEYSCTVVQ